MQIRCERTRLALATCNTKELPRLQQAFPECFEEGEETVFATWSDVIQREISKRSDNPDAYLNAAFFWADSCDGIPGALKFETPSFSGGRGRGYDAVPHELIEQITSIKALKGPLIVQYKGREWIVGCMYNAHQHPINEGDPGSLFATRHRGDLEIDLTIVPKELIALNL